MASSSEAAGGSAIGARRERFLGLTGPHVAAMLRTARVMIRDADRADDAVQEALLRAWKYFDGFDATRDVRVWLFAILRNVIFQAGRKRGREAGTASLDEVGAESVAGRAAPPIDRLTNQEILAAIEKLPEELRMVVLLGLVEQLKYREIAAALDIPIGTVMSRHFRARQLLRFHLRAYATDGTDGPASGGGSRVA